MAAWQTTTMTPDTTATADPYRFPGATAVEDQPRPPAALSVPDAVDVVDYLLAAPDPGQRVPLQLEPADRRRLDLHAALTTAGIAPLPGDLAAIEALCTLDDSTHTALQRWITRTT
ncbi:hypothetical protein [Streptomyces peucetius]|uniref:Uncharacterized protein n=1 Tax=Streptomyces peucetius TaxID=1950 RepID=A0ABY6IHC6_STRPE|nr:hypothetical protein [Streptomyces peucetius]UYQ66144.1 hypothetical protein OGH68_34940 [Streptomyces peucetius]